MIVVGDIKSRIDDYYKTKVKKAFENGHAEVTKLLLSGSKVNTSVKITMVRA